MDYPFSADRVAVSVGSRVKARRLELALSEDQVAAALHRTAAELEDAEAGRANFTADEIYALCGVLRVVPSWFFEGLV